jgi:hypothetical protein
MWILPGQAIEAPRNSGMNAELRLQRRVAAASQFNQRLARADGERIAGGLADGLGLLADMFLTRVHVDVQRNFGMDSMLMPASIVKTEEKAKTEIELFQICEAAAHVRDCRYVAGQDEWFLPWLAELRLGQQAGDASSQHRFAQYGARNSEDRRRVFSTLLERTLPEASRAPLVLYRLFPLGIDIAAALAFGDHGRAQEMRKRQQSILPGIGDCSACHGNVLDNGEKCSHCGNPVWKYDWLTAE